MMSAEAGYHSTNAEQLMVVWPPAALHRLQNAGLTYVSRIVTVNSDPLGDIRRW